MAPEIKDLIKYYQDTIHKEYSLCNALDNNSAYHHRKMPHHVRRTIEKAIHNKWIDNIACTTTLLQGVNLPAQNIIIRSPHLYITKQKNTAELSNYEMANLRGRAGRLLKDFIGRTFVLDENSFIATEGYEQIGLFDDVTKELSGDYGERFEKHKENIEEVVLSDTPVNNNMTGYADLVSYIRQSILRYNDNAKQKMQNVGIHLSKEQVAAIILKLDQISVPKEVCYKNRYWDPFVLDIIYQKYEENVPAYPLERGAKAKLDRMLKFLRDTKETSSMYNKYIPNLLRSGSNRGLLCDLCMLWAKETSLSDIIEKKRFTYRDTIADQIEDTIEILQDVVSYNVPLLLKPIFDIKNPNSSFLTSIQAGAYNKISRMLIEIGIPRECALYLYEILFKEYDCKNKSDEEIELDARNILRTNMVNLPYWIKVQLEFLE